MMDEPIDEPIDRLPNDGGPEQDPVQALEAELERKQAAFEAELERMQAAVTQLPAEVALPVPGEAFASGPVASSGRVTSQAGVERAPVHAPRPDRYLPPVARRTEPVRTKRRSRLVIVLVVLFALAMVPGIWLQVRDRGTQRAVGEQISALKDENTALDNQVATLMGPFDREMRGILQRLSPDGMSAAQVTAFRGALKQAMAVTFRAQQNAVSIAALWDEWAKLDMSKERRTYARQQIEIAKLSVRHYGATRDVFAIAREVLTGKLSRRQLDRRRTDLATLSRKGDQLRSRIDKLSKASARYYDEHF